MIKVVEPITEQELDTWVKALRSGKYIQGTGQLHRDGSYCCLGVLEHTLGHSISLGSTFLFGPTGDINQGIPRRKLSYDRQISLASMNDQRNPFNVIADYIEANKADILSEARA